MNADSIEKFYRLYSKSYTIGILYNLIFID